MRSHARVLLAAPDWPVPANHGGRIDILGRLHALSSMGAQVDLAVSSYEPPEPAQVAALRDLTRRVIWVPRRRGWRAHATTKPFQVASRSGFRSVALHPPYDLALLESHYVVELLANPALDGVPIALRVHNDEVRYFESLGRAEPAVVRRTFYQLEAWRFRRLARELPARIRHWLFLSTDELARFRAEHPDAHAMHLGPPWQPRNDLPHTRPRGTVLWFGALFMPNNRHGLDWYLRRVHPRLLADCPEYRLVIAGNARGADIADLRRLSLEPGQRIGLVESPHETRPLYDAAAAIVNPIFEGAGVKLKTINAFEHGVPLVSTSIGVEGIGLRPGEHVLVEDEPEGFAAAVRQTLEQPTDAAERVSAGRTWLAARGDATSALASLLPSGTAA
jgi:hypothetical protein